MLMEEVLAAMVEYEQERPRSKQLRLGPSELGGCREYIRLVLAGVDGESSDDWPAAAVFGTLWGDYVENVVAEKMGALTQVPVTATLPNGLVVSGTADMVFPERNLLADGKTKDGLAYVRKEGPSLENKVQVSIYVLGLVQAGILTEGAQAVLLYCDRSGEEQVLHEEVLSWEDLMNYIDVVCDRLEDVLVAQDHIDNGEVEWARALRDKTPPFCFSERVMCPFRNVCWEGSEWVPDEQITDEAVIETVHKYVEARVEVTAATDRKSEYRKGLIGVSGMTPSGYAVTWPGDGRALYVTKVRDSK